MIEWLAAIAGLLLGLGAVLMVWLVLAERRTPRLICLMYHRLAPGEGYDRTTGTERVFTVRVDSFESQIAHLKNAGYHFAAADEVRRFAAGEASPPQPAALITFDDGCLSIYRYALPVLERYGARATVFVTTDPESYVFRIGSQPDRRMSDDELRAADGGTLSIQAHALTHRPLRGLTSDEIRRELAESRSQLQRICGRQIEYRAIPGNWYDQRVMRIAGEVGYRAVWCSNPGAVRPGHDLFGLPRINVEGELTMAQFRAAISPWGVAQRRVLAAIKQLPGRLLGPKWWLPLRKAIMRCIPGGHLSMRRLIAAATLMLLAAVALIVLLLYATVSR